MGLLDPTATILAISLPTELSRTQRKEVADLVIEHIYDRTDRGLDKDGKKFPKYSKEYLNSHAGKIGGKGSKVDLQLTGDMLATLAILENSEGEIVLGWKSKTERAIAEGNILGSYGQSKENPAKARDFLGISDSKLQEIIDYVSG